MFANVIVNLMPDEDPGAALPIVEWQGSDQAAASVTVEKTAAVGPFVEAPAITSFTATPAQVGLGEPATLAWAVSGVAHDGSSGMVTLASNPLSTTSPSGGYPVTPVSGSYELQAIGNGRTVSATQNITVEPAVVSSFTASGSPLAPGQTATLSWTTEWATGVTIDPDPGVGALPAGGSVEVSPAADTTYTLTPTGLDPAPATAPVAVAPLITNVQVAWDATASLFLVWATENAATAVIAGSQSGSVQTSDTLSVMNPPADWWASMSFTSPLGASASNAVSIKLGDIPDGNVGDVAFQPAGETALNVPGTAVVVSWSALEIGDGQAGYEGANTSLVDPSPAELPAAPQPDTSPAWYGLLEDVRGWITVYVVMQGGGGA